MELDENKRRMYNFKLCDHETLFNQAVSATPYSTWFALLFHCRLNVSQLCVDGAQYEDDDGDGDREDDVASC